VVPALAAESIARLPTEQSGCLGARKSEAPKISWVHLFTRIPMVDWNPILGVATKGGSAYENINLVKRHLEA
jgi:hypothetical protein